MKLNPSKPILTAGRPAQRGIALVITLIMLSVTLIMAVAFLAVANRERATVTITSDGVNARLAADSALAAAQAQIMANVLGSGGGLYNSSLIVSTNYINYNGFVSGVVSPTNVNYDYYTNSSSPLSASDFETMVGNLLYLPRAPVMLSTNEPDGRFYLDLNRNGVFEPTSTNIVFVDSTGASNFNNTVSEIGDPQWIGVLQRPDAPHSADNQFLARYAFFAQPIGNSLDLNYIHNQVLNQGLGVADGFFRNQEVGSWEINLAAFLADVNPNEWFSNTVPDNVYYFYHKAIDGSQNQGGAFDDARSLLSWRYGFNYSSLASANAMFGNAANVFPFDNIDEYSDGPLQTTTTNIFEDQAGNRDDTTQSWAGADSTNRFFNLPAELFDPTKSSANFISRLTAASTRLANGAQPTYDRYTFYRMLQQMGTDSTADDDGKLNLNYNNTDGRGNVLRGVQTNLVPWTAITFFTNAADRMLRMYTTNWFQSNPSNYLASYYGITGYNYFYTYTNSVGSPVVVANDPTGFGLTNVPFFGMTNQIPAFGITDIPVYANSNFVYSTSVNRVLQLAANIYDASTNSFYPSVFRPLIGKDIFGNVFITGYTNLGVLTGGLTDLQLSTPFDAAAVAGLSSTFTNVPENIYGVPWIIGAKKGFPNFNELSIENNLAISRRLEFSRIPAPPSGGTPVITGTNQLYTLGLSSSFGIELWNSYASNYNDTIWVGMSETNLILLTNDENVVQSAAFGAFTNFPIQPWPGSGPWSGAGNPQSNSFVLPLNALVASVTNSLYRSPFATGATVPPGFTAPCLIPTNFFPLVIPATTALFETNSPNGFHFPQWEMLMTNRLQLYLLDFSPTTGFHIIDYVHFAGPNSSFNVNSKLADADTTTGHVGVWNTNYPPGASPLTGPTYGVLNQIKYSEVGNAAGAADDGVWNGDPALGSQPFQEAYFDAFFMQNNTTHIPIYASNGVATVQAPYTPTRYILQYIGWQANDPLVHYMASDFNYAGPTNVESTPTPGVTTYNVTQDIPGLASLNLGMLNDHYLPWGGNPRYQGPLQLATDTNRLNLAERDPLMMKSDNWDFPTNRYPTVGWLGRVHRGTPWQTVYLKSPDILAGATGARVWQAWTGNSDQFDATNDAPMQDAALFDIFTTALDDNASRGTLSVNQQNLAAWSALLSGVVVITNMTDAPNKLVPQPVNGFMIINPAGEGVGTNFPVWQMVEGTNGINATRTNLFANGAFAHIGDIVRVSALTQQSLFLNQGDATHQFYDISDEAYEQIPQQILGLLRVGSPRYVIYCYGQALRPAQDGVALDLNHNGLVTNYQVVAESAARAVVSVHPQVIYRLPSPPVTNYTTTVESYTPLSPN